MGDRTAAGSRVRTSGVALVLLSLLLGGCGGNSPRTSSHVTVAEGSCIFASSTLEDWKSYADHIVVYEAVSEREMPPQTGYGAPRDEGLIGRRVTVRVQWSLWSAKSAPELPDAVDIAAPGWTLHEGERRRLDLRGAPRLHVGQSFLAPLVWRSDLEPGRWQPLCFESQLEVIDGKATDASPNEVDETLREALVGESIERVEELIREQQRSPLAVKYEDLRPPERVQAVLDAGGFND